MNKLTIVSLALLCVLMTACSTEESQYDPDNDTLLEPRTANALSVLYTNEQGQAETILCEKAHLKYYTSNQATLTYDQSSGNQIVIQVSSAEFVGVSGNLIGVTIDEDTSYNVLDLNAEICQGLLCYENNSGTVAGMTVDFIVEDDQLGI